ncbi:uncharacterized membrane protein YhaH (DUF805 family) [Streptococcus rupicaprae]|uniref:Uncharacterized membrane protein YhaH (DUF805 family) n=1 Tax=Streptococcus rupicaprae TaxID=759619 RepID=A0ABV2FIN0_9STRE
MEENYFINQRENEPTFWSANVDYFKGVFSFKGYTTRRGYVYSFIGLIILYTVFQILSWLSLMSDLNHYNYYSNSSVGVGFGFFQIISILLFVPSVAQAVRRARDAGLTVKGYLVLAVAGFIPVINVVACCFAIYVALQPSDGLLTDKPDHFFFRQRPQNRFDSQAEQGNFYQREPLATNPFKGHEELGRAIQDFSDTMGREIDKLVQPNPSPSQVNLAQPPQENQAIRERLVPQEPLKQLEVEPHQFLDSLEVANTPSMSDRLRLSDQDRHSPTFQKSEESDAVKLWVEQFQVFHGRKPQPQEFLEAKQNHFALDSLMDYESEDVLATASVVPTQAESSEPALQEHFGPDQSSDSSAELAARESWIELFQAIHGRHPNPEEVQEACQTGFILPNLRPQEVNDVPVSERSSILSTEVETLEPQPEESLSAMPSSEEPASLDPSKSWVELFQAIQGRHPNPEELQEARQTGFVLPNLRPQEVNDVPVSASILSTEVETLEPQPEESLSVMPSSEEPAFLDPSKSWVELFQAMHGRNPNPQEFQAARQTDFRLTNDLGVEQALETQKETKESAEFFHPLTDVEASDGSYQGLKPEEALEEMPASEEAKQPFLAPLPQKRQKRKWLYGLVILIPLLAVGSWFLMGNRLSSKEVDLSEYAIAVTASGENGSGKAEVEVLEGPSFEGISEKAREFLENPKVTIRPKDKLSNGDRIEVEMSLDEKEAKALGLKPVGEYFEYFKIDGLKEGTKETKAETQEKQPPAPVAGQLQKNNISSVSATSYLSEPQYQLVHSPQNSIDGDASTAWVEDVKGQGEGESLTLQLNGTYQITKLALMPGYQKDDDHFYQNSRPSKVRLSFSDGKQEEFDLADRQGIQELTLSSPATTSSVTLTLLKVYPGSRFEDTAISEVSLYGHQFNQNSSQSQSLEIALESFLQDYRAKTNQSLSSRSASYIRGAFTSESNPYYVDTKAYIENQSASDGIARYDSRTDRLYNISETDDQVTFSLDYTTVIHYMDGRSPQTISNRRDYILKKSGNSFRIEKF